MPIDGAFPPTSHTAVAGAASPDASTRRAAHERIVQAYWKPVFAHIRRHWTVDVAGGEDLTQGFFAQALEKNWLAEYDPQQGTFRTYLRACVDGYLSHEYEAANRLKRGGGLQKLSLEAAEHISSTDTLAFEKDWIRELFQGAVGELQSSYEARSRMTAFAIFAAYDLAEERPTYQELAEQYKVKATDVTNFLAAARRDFRRCVLARLREISLSEEHFRADAKSVLGIDV